jgi:hypothetical protein
LKTKSSKLTRKTKGDESVDLVAEPLGILERESGADESGLEEEVDEVADRPVSGVLLDL